jgi:hypothetical protein
MGSIQDLLQEVPLAAVLKERVALADQKYESAMKELDDLKKKVEALERENANLRAQIPQKKQTSTLSEDATRVLVHLFKTVRIEERSEGRIARALNMEHGMLRYHLDRLDEAAFADQTGILDEDILWAITPNGRQWIVERKLIST